MLTHRQREVYDFIIAEIRRTGRAPVYKTIGRHFGWGCDTGYPYQIVKSISARGLLRQTKTGIMLPEGIRTGNQPGAFMVDYNIAGLGDWPRLVEVGAP